MYQPCTTINLQVLVHFVADFSVGMLSEAEKEVIIASEVELNFGPSTW